MTEPEDEIGVDLTLQSGNPPAAGRIRVFLTQSALEDMNNHAALEPEHEIGGIMVGSVAQDNETFVIVEAVIPGRHMTHSRGSVTFTHESWSEINRQLDIDYPDKKVVGWYHSHPGFGIFLSEYDLFIHRNFFSAPWQVAFVTDPRAKTCGIFTWQDGELRLDADSQVFTWTLASPEPVTPPTASALSAELPNPLPASPVPSRTPLGLIWALGCLAVGLALVAAVTLSTYLTTTQIRATVLSLQSDMQLIQSSLPSTSSQPEASANPVPAPSSGPSTSEPVSSTDITSAVEAASEGKPEVKSAPTLQIPTPTGN